jgi:hypothetical protein
LEPTWLKIFKGFKKNLKKNQVLKYPEPADSLTLVFFLIPGTGGSLKNQRTVHNTGSNFKQKKFPLA